MVGHLLKDNTVVSSEIPFPFAPKSSTLKVFEGCGLGSRGGLGFGSGLGFGFGFVMLFEWRLPFLASLTRKVELRMKRTRRRKARDFTVNIVMLIFNYVICVCELNDMKKVEGTMSLNSQNVAPSHKQKLFDYLKEFNVIIQSLYFNYVLRFYNQTVSKQEFWDPTRSIIYVWMIFQ